MPNIAHAAGCPAAAYIGGRCTCTAAFVNHSSADVPLHGLNRPATRGARKKKRSEAEIQALMMCHGALTMAASHSSLPGDSPVRTMAQVLLLLADGDDEAALERLAKQVRPEPGDSAIGGRRLADCYVVRRETAGRVWYFHFRRAPEGAPIADRGGWTHRKALATRFSSPEEAQDEIDTGVAQVASWTGSTMSVEQLFASELGTKYVVRDDSGAAASYLVDGYAHRGAAAGCCAIWSADPTQARHFDSRPEAEKALGECGGLNRESLSIEAVEVA